MMVWWNTCKEWFLSLGDKYHVNPYIFGSIYLGAIPLFFICLSWAIRRGRNERSIFIPVLLAGSCFISAYVYLIIAGKNIPVWVYGFIALMVFYGVFSAVKKFKKKTRAD